jgi:hypothetical protein
MERQTHEAAVGPELAIAYAPFTHVDQRSIHWEYGI